MERAKNLILLHLCVVIFSLTSVFSKLASGEYVSGGLTNPMLYLYLFLMFLDCFIYAICWQKMIKRFPLNIGYANRSLYLVWSQLWAVLIFHETLTVRNVLGMLTVLVGVIVVSLSAEHGETEKGE
ncbi:MAG: EamA-like transporter family protein [Clostridiales bacterium]|nr:EamA-like transporter family protein [Clostridiales bacterium]